MAGDGSNRPRRAEAAEAAEEATDSTPLDPRPLGDDEEGSTRNLALLAGGAAAADGGGPRKRLSSRRLAAAAAVAAACVAAGLLLAGGALGGAGAPRNFLENAGDAEVKVSAAVKRKVHAWAQRWHELTKMHHGDGTYYADGKWGPGSCGYQDHWRPKGLAHKNKVLGTVAMNPYDLRGHKMCGLCVKVWADGQGSGSDPMHWDGDLFRVDNICPECKKGDLDFRRQSQGDGRWKIRWKAVKCPEVKEGGVRYQLDSGDNQWYIKARPVNVPIPVTHMYMKIRGKWVRGDMDKGHYGFKWLAQGSPFSSPEVKLTFANHQHMIDQLPEKLDKLVKGKKEKVPKIHR